VLTETGDTSNTLYSERYKQTYHSRFGALTESMHVFLHGAHVATRLSARLPTRVLEIGFGLGLNCLLSADCAQSYQTPLHYTGIEHDPISGTQLHALEYQQLLRQPDLANSLAALLDNPAEPVHLGDHTTVELHVKNATSEILLQSLARTPPYDAIYLDAFSPEHNAECWTLTFLSQLHALLAPTGLLATYCVKGSVRRDLQTAGFTVEKYPGPIGKREVLRAFKTNKHHKIAR